MAINLFEQIKAVEESPDFSAALKGSYLCSAISFIAPKKLPEDWDLNYYNSQRDEIATIRVSESGTMYKGADKPFKNSVPGRVDLSKVSVSFEKAMELAESLRKKDHPKSSVSRIFISLHTEETEIWSINFIMGGIRIMQVKIDAHKGGLLESKMHEMIQKNGTAI